MRFHSAAQVESTLRHGEPMTSGRDSPGLRKFMAASVSSMLAVAITAASPVAPAVQLSQHGLGQVLLYPYYTIRTTPRAGPYNSLFIVTNTSPDTKVVRIRFRESKNGRPVASINVYLVPNDSWAAGRRSGPEFDWRRAALVRPVVHRSAGRGFSGDPRLSAMRSTRGRMPISRIRLSRAPAKATSRYSSSASSRTRLCSRR